MDKSPASNVSLHANAHMRRSLPHINPLNIEPSASFSQGFRDYFPIEHSPIESLFGDMEPQYTPSDVDQDIFDNYPDYDFSNREVERPAVPYAVERPDTIIQQSPDAHLTTSTSPIHAPKPLHSKMSPFHSFNQPSIFVQPNSMESLLSDTSSTPSDSSIGTSFHATQPLITSKQEQPRHLDGPSAGRSSGTIMPPLSPISVDMDLYSFNGPQQRRPSLPMPNELNKSPVSTARPGMYTSTSCPNTFESLDLTIPTTNLYSTTFPDTVSSTEAHTVYSPQGQNESQQSVPISMPMALRLYSDPTMYISGPASASNSSSISPGRHHHNINPSEWSPILAFRNMAVGDGQGVCNPQHVNGDISRDDGAGVNLQSSYDTSRSEGNVVGDVRIPRLSADADELRESDLWDDDYAEDEDDDEDYEDECDAGDDDDGEYVVPRRRSFVAGSSHDLRPRRRSSAGMASARYHPYPDSSDASSAHATMSTSSSSPALMSLPKPKVTRQPTSVPIPVPNLTKKSRGRRVPTIDSLTSGDKCRKNRSKQDKNEGECKNARTFICDMVGCGKCFARGEHLKRHVRSIHTHEKPHTCPHPDCDKGFSRYDNLRQHLRVHKDYFTEKDDISGMSA